MKNENIKKEVRKLLDVPKKARAGDKNEDIERELGDFLIKKGYIKGIEERDRDWGFVYHSFTRKVSVSEKEMPHRKWEDCIFKMGRNKETGENLFPDPGPETEKYRFLHEANHAYQEYLCSKESPEAPEEFYQKALEGNIDCPYARLFSFCFQKRKDSRECEKERSSPKGISVWGNAPHYAYRADEEIPNEASEVAVRAQEDANELVTMFLWHPDYFDMYLDYLSLNYENPEVREKELTREDLERRGLLSLSKEEASQLKNIVLSYVEKMKELIDNPQAC